MKGKSVAQHMGRLQDFYQRLNPGVDYYISPHRYACLDRISQQISAKKGAYTRGERLNWLSIIHTCLFAPSCYFPNERIPFKPNAVARYERKLKDFQLDVRNTQKENGAMGLYLQEIRHIKKNLEYKKYSSSPDCLKNFTDLLKSKLDKRAKKEHIQRSDALFDAAMARIEDHIGFALSNRAAWSFLPYCIFMELAIAEGLGSPNLKKGKDPISLPYCIGIENTPTWYIRSSPFRELNAHDMEQLQSLRNCVEKALRKATRDLEFTSIGAEAFQAQQNWRRSHPTHLQAYLCSDPSDEEENEHQFYYFYFPLWDQPSWSELIFKEFQRIPCESNVSLTLAGIQEELNRLFCQTISTQHIGRKSELRTEKEISSDYDDFSLSYQGKTLTLSKIMLALCTIFDPNQFIAAHPFQQPELQEAIQLLMDFWVCIDLEDEDCVTASSCPGSSSVSQEEMMYRAKWLMLISYSKYHPRMGDHDMLDFSHRWDEPSTEYFISPSDELIDAALSKAQAYNVKTQKKNIFLQNEYLQNEADRGNRIAMALCEGIRHVLLNEKDLLNDLAAFTGMCVCSSGGCNEGSTLKNPNLSNAISIWKERVASPQQKQRIDALQNYLKKNPGLSQKIYTSMLRSGLQIDLDVDLSKLPPSLDVNQRNTKKLKKQRSYLFTFFPESMTKLFKDVDMIPDFEYFLIAYYIVLDLRIDMSQKIGKLAAAIL